MESRGFKVMKKSSLYRSEPFGYKDQPWFLNMVIKAKTDLKPVELLKVVKEMEKEIGRKKGKKWGPRVIDIDILLYGDEIIDEADLKIPHAFMHMRRFVLEPLYEIARSLRHPKSGKSVKDLLKECKDASIVNILHK